MKKFEINPKSVDRELTMVTKIVIVAIVFVACLVIIDYPKFNNYHRFFPTKQQKLEKMYKEMSEYDKYYMPPLVISTPMSWNAQIGTIRDGDWQLANLAIVKSLQETQLFGNNPDSLISQIRKISTTDSVRNELLKQDQIKRMLTKFGVEKCKIYYAMRDSMENISLKKTETFKKSIHNERLAADSLFKVFNSK